VANKARARHSSCRYSTGDPAKDIANNFETLKNIEKASIDDINKIPNIGPVVSRSVYDFFHDKTHLKFIEKFLTNGIKIKKIEKNTNGKFIGMTFVLTGTLPSLSRDQAKEMINKEGGKVSSSVSKNTNYLLAGENTGLKYDEAIKFGVKILDEEEFIKMLK
jgi:DNA ligase (NAD+)